MVIYRSQHLRVCVCDLVVLGNKRPGSWRQVFATGFVLWGETDEIRWCVECKRVSGFVCSLKTGLSVFISHVPCSWGLSGRRLVSHSTFTKTKSTVSFRQSLRTEQCFNSVPYHYIFRVWLLIVYFEKDHDYYHFFLYTIDTYHAGRY